MTARQQTLYTENDRSGVQASDFVNAVCDSASQAFSNEVSRHVDLDAGFLPNEVTMPLALVIKELLTNAAKHGCDDTGKCDTWISFTRDAGDFVLTVRDSGPGFEFEDTGRRSSGTA